MVDEAPKSEAWDAVRRTRLAAERTELAWWRTALTSIAVAIAVGRVVPELSGTGTEWPYLVVGIGWALYSVALFAYGSIRSRNVEAALDSGRMIPSSADRVSLAHGVRGGPLSRDRRADRRLRLNAGEVLRQISRFRA